MKILLASPEGISTALRLLHDGGVVAHATETCYGFACDLTNINAVKRLFDIKQRPPDQPVSALFASIGEATKYVEWNEEADELAQKYLPGPLTLVLPLRNEWRGKIFWKSSPIPLPPSPDGGGGIEGSWGIGVRISSHSVAQQLALAFGKPLSTTSANIHGQPNPYSADDIIKQFATTAVQPDLVLDSGTLPSNKPSTVINLVSTDGGILRSGAIKPTGR